MLLRKYPEHIFLSIALITTIQLGIAFKFGVFSGLLADQNCYDWLNRVVQLHESGQWFDATFHRVDPPYGFEQHCTRPFDVLLLAGAWALSPLAGFEKALHFWAALISPLLHVFSALFLVWACSPVFNEGDWHFWFWRLFCSPL